MINGTIGQTGFIPHPTNHIEALNNGGGAPSMMMMVLAGQRKIPSTICITADTGSEEDCLLNTGERVTMTQFYNDVIEPLGIELGIKTYYARGLDKNKKPLPSIMDKLRDGIIPGVPTYGSKGGQLKQGCTQKWKVRPIRQTLRKLEAKTARSALGLTMDEVERVRQHNDVKWHWVWWPLIELGLYRAGINETLEKMSIPYMIASQCDNCPHKNGPRWERTSQEKLQELAMIEAGLGGTQFFTPLRIPLLEAVPKMINKEQLTLPFCESGYCMT